jgi:hypothetical protein
MKTNKEDIMGHASFHPYDTSIKNNVIANFNKKKEVLEMNQEGKTSGKFKHLMLDIESLGKAGDSVILSIGAVAFNMDGIIGPSYEMFPTVQDQIETRKVEWDTIQWWFKQSDAARNSIADTTRRVNLKSCLEELTTFCHNELDDKFKVWSNGASFDIAMLNLAYDRAKLETPWTYRNQLDCRTICWLSKISTKKYESDGIKHSAVADCHWQISWTTDAYKILKGY